MPFTTITRRGLFGLGTAAAAAVALPGVGSAAGSLIDPYHGAIPMTFPLAEGTYHSSTTSDWHEGREGRIYPWTHVNSATRRAHDGTDVYPAPGALPAVYAPLSGTVAAVCVRSANTPGAAVAYRVSSVTPPPWDYSQAVDDVAGLPLYGNLVWLYSTDANSRGYFVLFCHLQDEPVIRALTPDQPVGAYTRIGALGDTGNAAGAPQLHTEIHYPAGSGYPCSRCAPRRVLTAINPEASLRQASRRAALAS